MMVYLRVVIEVVCGCIYCLQCVPGGSIKSKISVKAADIEMVHDPWESSALTNGAVDPNSLWEELFNQGVEGDGLSIAKPHREICNHCLLQF